MLNEERQAAAVRAQAGRASAGSSSSQPSASSSSSSAAPSAPPVTAQPGVQSTVVPAKGVASDGSIQPVMRAGTGSSRTWTSTDKYVGETANAIEAKYPGKVVDVNKKVYRVDGTPLTDYDIELDNVIIQVKQGGGKGATRQAINTASSTNKKVVVFLPDQNSSAAVVKGLQKMGFSVFTDLEALLNCLK
jgi:hypothetical protein